MYAISLYAKTTAGNSHSPKIAMITEDGCVVTKETDDHKGMP